MSEIARRLGHDWGHADRRRRLERIPRGRSAFRRRHELRAPRGAAAAFNGHVPDESHPGETFLHGRLWEVPRRGRAAPFSVVHHDPPVEQPDDEYPARADDRPAARVVQHRGADGRVRLAAAQRRDARHLARGRGAVSASPMVISSAIGRAAARVAAPARIDHGAACRHGLHDAALPRRRADQPPDDRRVRSEVRDGRVQGVCGPCRRARARRVTARRRASAATVRARGVH